MYDTVNSNCLLITYILNYNSINLFHFHPFLSYLLLCCLMSVLFCSVQGMAALSLLTSGKYVLDPEERGLEFERITQNLDMQFWKTFWNLTECGLISVGNASIPQLLFYLCIVEN